jgi:hypothetical protein
MIVKNNLIRTKNSWYFDSHIRINRFDDPSIIQWDNVPIITDNFPELRLMTNDRRLNFSYTQHAAQVFMGISIFDDADEIFRDII